MIWAGVSTLALAGMRQDDKRAAEIAAVVLGAGLVTGGIWWAWYRESHGPMPGRGDLPGPARGTRTDVRTQLEPGEGYSVARPPKAYGRAATVAGVVAGVARFRSCAGPDAPQLVIGNMSVLGGGPLPPHASHRTGRDVDIGLPDGEHNRWCLLRAFMVPEMEYIFYDGVLLGKTAIHAFGMGGEDADLAELELGPKKRVRHWAGHKDHIHVRFLDE